MEPEDNALDTPCPMCGREGNIPIGILGRLIHYRCKACGFDFSEQL